MLTQINPEVFHENGTLTVPNQPQTFQLPAGKQLLNLSVIVGGSTPFQLVNGPYWAGSVTVVNNVITVTTPFIGNIDVTAIVK